MRIRISLGRTIFSICKINGFLFQRLQVVGNAVNQSALGSDIVIGIFIPVFISRSDIFEILNLDRRPVLHLNDQRIILVSTPVCVIHLICIKVSQCSFRPEVSLHDRFILLTTGERHLTDQVIQGCGCDLIAALLKSAIVSAVSYFIIVRSVSLCRRIVVSVCNRISVIIKFLEIDRTRIQNLKKLLLLFFGERRFLTENNDPTGPIICLDRKIKSGYGVIILID